MNLSKRLLIGSVTTIVATCTGACGGDDFSSTTGEAASSGTGGAGASGGSGGDGGQGGGGGTPAGCVPSENDDPVEDSCGFFVSSSKGADANAGTKSKPFATIDKALAAAKGKPIYVCAEAADPYAENVKIAAGAELYGGLDCGAGWKYEAAKPTRVAPSTGYPLRIENAAEQVLIEDFDFQAADATEPGGSSVAAFVSGSTDVVLARVQLMAGRGVKGTDSTLDPFEYPAQTALNGNDGTIMAGGAKKDCPCPGGDMTSGGIGGTPPNQAAAWAHLTTGPVSVARPRLRAILTALETMETRVAQATAVRALRPLERSRLPVGSRLSVALGCRARRVRVEAAAPPLRQGAAVVGAVAAVVQVPLQAAEAVVALPSFRTIR